MKLEHRARCEVRLGELDATEITKLTRFAEHRLLAMGLNPAAGEDLTQCALARILKGLEPDQGGRVPRLVDVETKEAFANFTRGAISSLAEAMRRKREFQMPQTTWEDDRPTSIDGGCLNPARTAELADLKDAIFPRLRARAAKYLQPTISAWEEVFEHSEKIPTIRNRRDYSWEVRHLAQSIVAELGGLR